MTKPTPPSSPADQAELAAMLAAHEGLLDRYRALPKREPPARLDAAILMSARRAVGQRARPRWWIPLASAASLVVAAGIGWRVHLAGSNVADPIPEEIPEAGEAQEIMLYESPVASPPPAARPAAEKSLDVVSEAKPKRERAPESTVDSPTPAAEAGNKATPADKAVNADLNLGKATDAIAPPPAPDAADAANPSPAGRPPAAPPPAAAFTDDEPAGLDAPAKLEPLPEPPKETQLKSLPAAPRAEEEPPPAAAPSAAAGATTRQNSDAEDQAASAIAAIEALLAQGRIDEARGAIRAFRSRYPDHSLPAEWRRYEH